MPRDWSRASRDHSCADRARTPGLFAVGEVIGDGATCGNSLCSGMLLTPHWSSGACWVNVPARSPADGLEQLEVRGVNPCIGMRCSHCLDLSATSRRLLTLHWRARVCHRPDVTFAGILATPHPLKSGVLGAFECCRTAPCSRFAEMPRHSGCTDAGERRGFGCVNQALGRSASCGCCSFATAREDRAPRVAVRWCALRW